MPLPRLGRLMPELTRRGVPGGLVVRADPAVPSERIIEGVVVPWNQVATVADPGVNGGRPYRESIARGAPGELDPATVLLEYLPQPNVGQGHAGAVLVGRGEHAEDTDAGLFMRFRVSRTSHGTDALELANDGILTDLSVVMQPIAERKRGDGVIERTRVGIRRVGLVERGAYQEGAQVTAVRAAAEGTAMPNTTAPTSGATTTDAGTDDGDELDTEATPASGRPHRTRVTVDVDRAAAERAAVDGMARSARAFAPFGSTREESVYGPGSGQSFFGDGWAVSQRAQGWEDSQGRLERHYRMLDDIDLAMQRRIGIASLQRASGMLSRAGDVLSSEIGGAYPNEYLPGLLVPRILKQRPMGGFYSRVPLTDGRPRIYPVVSTSTTVAVQSAEAANPAASDFATTGTTVTPLFYGGETKVSRQVLDGADPSTDAMLMQDLTEAYMQASEAIIRAAVEAGSTASGVTLTAATPDAGIRALYVNHIGNVFLPPERLFLPTTLTNSWLTQNDTTGRPLAPAYGAMNSDSVAELAACPSSALCSARRSRSRGARPRARAPASAAWPWSAVKPTSRSSSRR
jgi:HK97 family phage prohead protease